MNASFVYRTCITKMLRVLVVCVCYAALAFSAAIASAANSQSKGSDRVFNENPKVVIETTEGNIEIELLPKFAPKHVNNFLNLVEKVVLLKVVLTLAVERLEKMCSRR